MTPVSDLKGRRARRWRVAVSATAVLTALSFLFSVILAQESHKRAVENHQLALEAKHLAIVIQTQRVTSIRNNCLSQNKRNRDTIRALDGLIAKLPPERRVIARAGRLNTVLLISTLAPYQDCSKVVRAAAPTPTPGRDR